MGKKILKKILENPANLTGEKVEDHFGCDKCSEQILFRMKDNYHEFSMGVETILNCLRLAEEKGAVPKLPDEWWLSVMDRYNIYSNLKL